MFKFFALQRWNNYFEVSNYFENKFSAQIISPFTTVKNYRIFISIRGAPDCSKWKFCIDSFAFFVGMPGEI
jgi:hypothetical protein